jgi:L-asparaginase
MKKMKLLFVPALILAALTVAALPALAGRDAGPTPLPHVIILATGGTIAGSAPSPTETKEYKPGALDVGALIRSVPGLDGVARITGEQIADIGSNEMTDEIMMKVARRASELLARNDVDGVVVTHGTDTMEETAYFLNLSVKNDKPVVLVGSMRPATAMSADGPLNLFNAVSLASSKAARGKGALVTLNDKIHGARDVMKTNTTNADTFKSPDFGCLGYVLDGRVTFYRTVTRRHTAGTEFSLEGIKKMPRVDIIYGHAGGERELTDAAVRAGAEGIVHAGMGDGSMFGLTREALREARAKGVIVIRSSRVGSGMVTRTAEDQKDGFVAADTLNPQKARILLMFALTKTRDIKEIKRIFEEY